MRTLLNREMDLVSGGHFITDISDAYTGLTQSEKNIAVTAGVLGLVVGGVACDSFWCPAIGLGLGVAYYAYGYGDAIAEFTIEHIQ